MVESERASKRKERSEHLEYTGALSDPGLVGLERAPPSSIAHMRRPRRRAPHLPHPHPHLDPHLEALSYPPIRGYWRGRDRVINWLFELVGPPNTRRSARAHPGLRGEAARSPPAY